MSKQGMWLRCETSMCLYATGKELVEQVGLETKVKRREIENAERSSRRYEETAFRVQGGVFERNGARKGIVMGQGNSETIQTANPGCSYHLGAAGFLFTQVSALNKAC